MLRGTDHVLIDVADRGDAHILETAEAFDMVHTPPVHADHGDPQDVIGA